MDDRQLIDAYVTARSEPAFADLVNRYVDLVYSACLRQLSDKHLAEDATQAVFVILAQKASTLRTVASVPAWLLKVAYFVCGNLRTREAKRRARERRVAAMIPTETPAPAWDQLAPVLDQGLASLNDDDRAIITLKYLQGLSPEQIAATLELSQPAAEKRITRAMEKLRNFYRRKGIVLSAAVLALAISSNAVQAAPAGLGSAATTITLATLHGAALPAKIATLTKGTLTMMKLASLKPAIAAGVAVLLLAGAGSLAVSYSFATPRPAPVADAAVTADPIPSAAKGFAGMVRGTVAARGEGNIILTITEITRSWKHSKATDASTLVGKKILVVAGNANITKYLNARSVGDNIYIDVNNKEGDTLTFVELTKEQRDSLPKGE